MNTNKLKPCGRTLFVSICAVVFLYLLALNFLTPYLADDFTFAYAFDTGERLHSIPQLFQSLAFHYQEWTGRVVVKFFAQGFTMLPKAVFNLCNAAAYLGLGLVIYRLALGRRSGRYDVLALLLIWVALWEVSPAFGQTNLWMCGACNYLWASLGCLAFLLPYRYHLQRPIASTPLLAVCMAVAGLLAGWLSENTSAGLLAAVVLCLCWLLYKKQRVPLWGWTGLAGAIIGFALLILAPGNYNRAKDFASEVSFLTKYATRFLACTNMLRDNAMPLLLAFGVLYLLLVVQRKNGARVCLFWPAALLLAGLCANYAMLLSPFYYQRSSHGVFSLLTAACIACLVQLQSKTLRQVFGCAAACLCLVCAFDVVDATYDIASYAMMVSTREALIKQEAAGQDAPYTAHVISYGIEPYTRWCGGYGLPDIRENDEDAIAMSRAKWYGLFTISAPADDIRTYPFPGHTNAAYEAGLAVSAATSSDSSAPAQ